jgi:hypothetical protein
VTLKRVLAEAAEADLVVPHLGERVARTRQAGYDLQEHLRAVSSGNALYFRICFALLLVLFSGACVLVLNSLHNPNQVAIIFGITGVSFMGIFRQMVKLWKDKVNSDMLLVLAGSMKKDDLRSIVQVLVDRYK